MEFTQYVEIENTTRDKFIEYYTTKYPILLDSYYVIEEKIHGTNVRFHFENGIMTIGSRNRTLPDGEDHDGLRSVIPSIQPVIDHFMKFTQPVTIFGELFGANIMKGVNYGNKKRILFFDASLDKDMLSFDVFKSLFFGLEDFVVPILGIAKNLKEALAWSPEFQSHLSPDGSMAEGIVIKPMDIMIPTEDHETFYLKRHALAFEEKKRAPKTPRDEKESKTSLLEPYITEQRMFHVFSKEGKIKDKLEIPKYIKLITEDAVKDFEKDNPAVLLAKDDIRVGSNISKLLLKEL